MQKYVVSAGMVVVMSAGSAVAQVNSCPGGSAVNIATQDACQKAVDLYQFLAPQLGAAIAGGNATLGRGGTLGGFPHFSIGVRVNGVIGSLPKIDEAGATPVATGANRTDYNTSSTIFPIPTADAAIGLFKGFPVGVTNVGGIDALVSASYIPSVDVSGVSVDPDSPFKFGYGVRVGALQESIVSPGIAITWLKRDLPKVDLTGAAGAFRLNVHDIDEQTSAWRIVASKSLVFFGIAAGYGQDRYKSSAVATGEIDPSVSSLPGGTSSPVDISQSMTRQNVFLDLSFNMPLLKFVAEVGRVFGGDDVATFNTFGDREPNSSRTYASVGLRFSY